LNTLEHIHHFKYPPWGRSTPYTVNIDNLPKDKAATAHNSIILLTSNNTTWLYSDTSAFTGDITTNGIGVAFTAINFNSGLPKSTFFNSVNLGHSQLVYNSELEGITMAVEYASEIATPNH
jgi:hypothetical protein